MMLKCKRMFWTYIFLENHFRSSLGICKLGICDFVNELNGTDNSWWTDEYLLGEELVLGRPSEDDIEPSIFVLFN
jgi:hypothetical protein